MAKIQRVGDLEIDQSLDFQRREWKAERIGWAVMALVLLAALLGFFGGAGPFSTATAGEESGTTLRVEYQPFARFKSPSSLRVRLAAGSVGADTVRVWIDRRYLSGVSIEHVTPEPDNVEAGSDRLIYTFSVADPGAAVEISFGLTLDRIGLRKGHVGHTSGSSIQFQQFVYP